MFSSATQPPPRRPPPPRHKFVVSAITFEGFKLRSSNLTHALLIQIYRTSSIIDIVVPSKMSKKKLQKSCVSIWKGQKCDRKLFADIQNGGRRPFCKNKTKSSIWIWNGQKCHRKWISDIQNGWSIWNGQKCDPRWFSDIQNGRRKRKKNLYRYEMARIAIESEFWKSKMAHRSEMARNAIESEFRTSKMADGSHFVKNFSQKLKLRIDLKWPEMLSKVNFGHPKWSTSAILSKIKNKSCVSMWNG